MEASTGCIYRYGGKSSCAAYGGSPIKPADSQIPASIDAGLKNKLSNMPGPREQFPQQIQQIYSTGKSLPIIGKICQSLAIKIFWFSETKSCAISLRIPFHSEGRFANVTNVGTGCGGRDGARDGRCRSGRAKSCGPDSLRVGVKSAEVILPATVTSKSGSPGRARISLKPLRRESRMPPLHLYARVLSTS